MSRARHKRASTPLRVRGVTRFAIPVAVLAAAPVGAVATNSSIAGDAANTPTELEAGSAFGAFDRQTQPSRGEVDRSVGDELIEAVAVSIKDSSDPEPDDEDDEPDVPEESDEELTVADQMYATAGLNVRPAPDVDSDVLTVLARGTEVDVTDTTDGDWVQILLDDEGAWVHGDYLSEDEPSEEESGGISYEPCPIGSESGLTQDAVRVLRAVCAEFPAVDSYGGYRGGGGAHSEGRAIDIMISSSSQGDSIAAWVRDNHSALGVSEVIWSQRIWTVERSSDGWRWMEDRGSDTANHYDHVHVTVYGNAGG